MPHDTQTDLRLLEELRDGRDSALNEIMDRWERPLTSFAWRYVQNETDAQDMVQETFVKVYKYKDRFRPDTRLSAWLFTTLANQCRNFGRWKRRHPTVALLNMTENADEGSSGVSIEIPDLSPTPDSLTETNDLIEHLRSAIMALPHDLKTTLLLYQYERLSYKEIAEILGCSPKGVETRLYRTRKRLRRMLKSKIKEVHGIQKVTNQLTG
ncbi:MAG: sigma-70 family RNA polymerase sigma factor [Verrucomicrobia bacterium]|nr:sigma-70 family RNA polymerase sigma factor [Verrucomicrobiota bacterium]